MGDAITLGKSHAYPTASDFYPGLTMRELFAAMAMQGMAAGQWAGEPAEVARYAVAWADTLIAELAKENS